MGLSMYACHTMSTSTGGNSSSTQVDTPGSRLNPFCISTTGLRIHAWNLPHS